MTFQFVSNAHQAIQNAQLQQLLDLNAARREQARAEAMRDLVNGDELRERARASRSEVVSRLHHYVAEFSQQLAENGITLHRAATAADANRLILEIVRRHGAELVAKSKSMVTEEIDLNKALESDGVRVVETDLGEYIVQLRREPPAHLLTPALHLTREQVSTTINETLNTDINPEVEEIVQTARESLHEVFMTAAVGITGVNFGVANTGTLCIVSNEGNGRMVATLPPVHIAVMGMERLVATVEELAVMLQLLPRSATGQKITSYVSLISAPRRETEPDGASERYVILVDNGRSAIADTALAEALNCIRCGACLNACPVFREAGGHSYESVYAGPIGSVVSPALFGIEQYGQLAKASSLCGACVEACPVGIDIPRMLLQVRATAPKQVPQIHRGIRAYTWVARSPRRFRLAQRLAGLVTRLLPIRAGWIARLPDPLAEWTRYRDFPAFAPRPFRARFRKIRPHIQSPEPDLEPPVETMPLPEEDRTEFRVDDFERELRAIGGEVIRCSEDDAPDRIVGELYILGASELLTWGPVEPILFTVLQRVREEFRIALPDIPPAPKRLEALQEYSQAHVGITGSVAAFADTGTIVLSSASRRSLLPSLLPPAHIAIVREKDIYNDMESWLEAGGSGYIANSSNVVFISGPSRTADIEMTLTIGVHGPPKMIAVILEEPHPRTDTTSEEFSRAAQQPSDAEWIPMPLHKS